MNVQDDERDLLPAEQAYRRVSRAPRRRGNNQGQLVGSEVRYSYDARGRLLAVDVADGGQGDAVAVDRGGDHPVAAAEQEPAAPVDFGYGDRGEIVPPPEQASRLQAMIDDGKATQTWR